MSVYVRCVQNVLREGEGEEVDLSTAVCVRRVRVMVRVVRPDSTCYTFKKRTPLFTDTRESENVLKAEHFRVFGTLFAQGGGCHE